MIEILTNLNIFFALIIYIFVGLFCLWYLIYLSYYNVLQAILYYPTSDLTKQRKRKKA